jgi:2-aminobenzoate-CoA ligase
VKLSPSAHVDTFCRDNLPADENWPTLVFELPELQYPERINCAASLLDDAAATYGADRPCLLTPDETWTYGDLVARSNQVARVLTEDFGMVPGQRVLLRGPNNPWLVACWFGVVKAGCVAVTTMPLLRSFELAPLVGLTRPALLLCDHRFEADLAGAAPDLPLVMYGGAEDGDLIKRCAAKPASFTSVDTAADDVALLAMTSGTTGSPKVAMHFHRDVLAVTDTFGKYLLKAQPTDIFTGTPPLGFAYGVCGLMALPMRTGASVLLLERAAPAEFADAVAQFQATVLFTSPTAYRAMLRAGKAGRLASLRRAVSAGETLPKAVWDEFFEKTGVRIIDAIGSTEMLNFVVGAADDDIRPGSTGKALPGYQAAVLGPDGRRVPDGMPGQLAAIGPIGCRYLADPRQAVYVRDGWNVTGDSYIRDADGYFWYQGRSDDIIVSSGYNIAPTEIERALEQHPDVTECAVVGKPDTDRGLIVHAAVVLRDGVVGDAAEIAELQAFMKQRIAPYKYPRSIEFVDALPRTTTGKVQRFRLRAGADH